MLERPALRCRFVSKVANCYVIFDVIDFILPHTHPPMRGPRMRRLSQLGWRRQHLGSAVRYLGGASDRRRFRRVERRWLSRRR